MKPIYLLFNYILGLVLLGTTLISCKKGSNAGDEVKENTVSFGKFAYFANASASSTIKVDGLVKADTALNTVTVNWS